MGIRQKLPFCSKKRICEPASCGNKHRSVYLCLDIPEINIGSLDKLFKCFGLATLTERLDNLQALKRALG